ncbi:MAG: hypothetical protein ACREBU_05295 [Nitrososphaera sp.]
MNKDNTQGLKHIDMSSEERLIKYSRDIQKFTKRWLDENVGQIFDSNKEMAMECANTMKFGVKGKQGSHPSWKTVLSHIEQYTVANEAWELVEQVAGITIERRSNQK